ncbi:interleukin-6-like [Corythoichthys intestinalis]|uniref:interleukin-6-like n=1 Tax=Corythoichthys intestinalis TaxID=161448 RepID=UPI0025A629FF|nr:interleukin-6-like [Corythoichthys intestinalis]
MYAQIFAFGSLASLVLCVTGAPTVLPSGEHQSEEELFPSISPVWESVLGIAKDHKKDFEDEFGNNVKYHQLENYKVPQMPASCPISNFSMEACLHRLAQGLTIYTNLLKDVEKVYPGQRILSEAKHYTGLLLRLFKQKMKKPEEFTVSNSSQTENVSTLLDNRDEFQRKMTVNSILRQLFIFLVDGKRVLTKKERRRGRHPKVTMFHML